jgi:hypothetical protein
VLVTHTLGCQYGSGFEQSFPGSDLHLPSERSPRFSKQTNQHERVKLYPIHTNINEWYKVISHKRSPCYIVLVRLHRSIYP